MTNTQQVKMQGDHYEKIQCGDFRCNGCSWH